MTEWSSFNNTKTAEQSAKDMIIILLNLINIEERIK